MLGGKKIEAGKGNWKCQNGKCSGFLLKWDGHGSEDKEVKKGIWEVTRGKEQGG